MNNPHIGTEGLLAVYREREDLTLEQQFLLRQQLLNRNDLPQDVREKLRAVDARKPWKSLNTEQSLATLRASKAIVGEAHKKYRKTVEELPELMPYAQKQAIFSSAFETLSAAVAQGAVDACCRPSRARRRG